MQVQKDPPEEWNHRQLYATLSVVYNQPVYNPYNPWTKSSQLVKNNMK